MKRLGWLGLMGLLLGFGMGCEPTPKAPSLDNVAVYQERVVGIRFLAPEGWILYARTMPPRGRVEKPIRLVGFQRGTADGRAELELYICDYSASQSLNEYLKAHPIGPERWKELTPPQPVTLGGVSGLKHTWVTEKQAARQRDLCELRREGDRVFLFVCTAMTMDRSTRDQARRAVETVTFQVD